MRRIYTFFFTTCTLLLFGLSVHAEETISQNNASATNLGLYGGQIRYIAIDPNSDYIYAGAYSPNGVFISPDNGATWEGVSVKNDFGEIRGVALNSQGDLFVLANSLYTSTDRGETFTEIEGIGAYGATLTYAQNTIAVGRTDGAVSMSTNDGVSFVTQTLESGGNVLSVAPSPTSGTWYAVVQKGSQRTLYKTVNSGSSWSLVDTTSVSAQISLVAVDPFNANHIFVIGSPNPWHSTDGGATWTQLSVTPYATHVSFDSTGRIYAGVHYSDDDGSTWAQLQQSTPSSRVSGIVVPDPQNDDILYAGSFAALAKSVNKGTSWVDTNKGITAVTTKDIAQSKDKETVWVATNAGLAKTENFLDDAPTWEFPLYYDLFAQSVWVSPTDSNIVVAGGMGAVAKTINGGDSWQTATGWESDFTGNHILQDVNNENILYATANMQETKNGAVFMSTDQGSTWTDLAFPENLPAQTIAQDSTGRVYVGVGNINLASQNGSGIYIYENNAWSKLTNFVNGEVTNILVDPNDDSVVYALVSDFNTYGADSDTISGVYRSKSRGENWKKITTDLEDATKFRDIEAQPKATGETTLYLSAADKLSQKGVIYKSKDGGDSWGKYYTGLRNETFYRLLFDGLLAGNARGLYGVEAKVNLKIKTKRKKVQKGKMVVIRVTAKDAATQKKLKKRKIVLLRAVGKKKFRVYKAKKTNAAGVVRYKVPIKKKSRFMARFVPKKAIDKEEYQKSLSQKIRIQLKKI